MRKNVLLLFNTIVFMLICSCAVPLAGSVMLIGVSNEFEVGKSIGIINGEDCATNVFGFGRSPLSLTLNAAVERAQAKNSLRYLNGVSVDSTHSNIVVYNRQCMVIRGEGFK